MYVQGENSIFYLFIIQGLSANLNGHYKADDGEVHMINYFHASTLEECSFWVRDMK